MMSKLKNIGIILVSIICIFIISMLMESNQNVSEFTNEKPELTSKITKEIGYALNKSKLHDLEVTIHNSKVLIRTKDGATTTTEYSYKICNVIDNKIMADGDYIVKNGKAYNYLFDLELTSYDLNGNILHTSNTCDEYCSKTHYHYEIPHHPDFASCDISLYKIQDLECINQDRFAKSLSGYDGIGCVIPEQYWSFECKDPNANCKNIVYDRP